MIDVYKILNMLHIDYEEKTNNNWLLIRCPLHNDNNISNCGINLDSLVIHCFSCKASKHLIPLVKERLNISYSEAYKLVMNKDINELNNITSLDFSLSHENNKDYKTKSEKKNFNFVDEKLLRSFNPEKYYYTRKRGFTKHFCESFSIKECVGGYYDGYMITPVVDSEQKIFTFEARKVEQVERLKEKGLTDELLDCLKKADQLVIKNGKSGQFLYSKKYDKVIDDGDLRYLLSKKVLYASNNMIKETLWNIDNLNYNEDLWLSEGMGTQPKLYSFNKNSSCPFGSELSENQVEILKRFKKRIIVIPDGDDAGAKMIERINIDVKNVCVADTKSDDTSRSFVEDVRNARIVEAQRYIANYYKLFDF